MLLLVSFACAIILCFRHRGNFLVPSAVVACLPPLLLPTDALPALIGAASVFVWTSPVLARLGVGALAAIATASSLWKDTRGTHTNASFWNGLFHSASEKTWPPMPAWQVFVLTLACLGSSIGIATLRRSRLQIAGAEHRADAALRTARGLQADATRREEREALAREVHDVLGHRLSILSMQASALEVEAADAQPAVRDRAHQIQAGAADSMSDLRSLLALLREGPSSAEKPSDLTDIARLVQECIAAGTPVSSNVFVDRSTPLDDVVSRSAYRITMELLTNARKHAPGRPVSLEIFGDSRAGLTITAANPVDNRTGAATASRSGVPSGLTGIGARAYDLGGTFSAGTSPDGRTFTASAHIPWHLPQHSTKVPR